MSNADQDLLSAFDGHEVEGVRAALDAGADACSPIRGKLPVLWLLEEYTRSDRLPDCLRLLFERGAVLPDPAVAPVLLNDADAIRAAVRANPSLLEHCTTLTSSFTPLVGVSLLHVAAEYGNLDAARALVEAGADVNAAAAVDEHGLNGHTPLFHTVNSNRNRSEPIMRLLLAAGAKPDVRLAGITWARGTSGRQRYSTSLPSRTPKWDCSHKCIGASEISMPTSGFCSQPRGGKFRLWTMFRIATCNRSPRLDPPRHGGKGEPNPRRTRGLQAGTKFQWFTQW
jgi:hypothetical protein